MSDNPTAGTLRAQVFNCVHESPAGRTAKECGDLLGMTQTVASDRLREMGEMGGISQSGAARDSLPVWIVASRQRTVGDPSSRHAVQCRALGIAVQEPTPYVGPGGTESPIVASDQPVAGEGQRASDYIAVDGKNVLYWLYHASKKSGSNARLRFQMFLAELRDVYQPPGGVIVAWDADGDTWRHAEFPEYKAQRSEIDPMLAQMNNDIVSIVGEVDGVRFIVAPGFEADDILGTLAAQAVAAKKVLSLVTTDKDIYQAVSDPYVEIIDRNREGVIHEAQVREIWGVAAAYIPDMLALVGDKADNLPGVMGIGKKTAPKLLAAHTDLEGVIAAARDGTIKGKRRDKILADAERARLILRLARLTTDVPGVDLNAPKIEFFPELNDNHGTTDEETTMARKLGWRWTRPKDTKQHTPPLRAGEPVERWERDDHWGYMAADETDGGWYMVHRANPDVRHDTETADIGKALARWGYLETHYRIVEGADPAAGAWTEDWRGTSDNPQPVDKAGDNQASTPEIQEAPPTPGLSPIPDDNPQRGLAAVLAMWARHGLNGHPQMLVWEVDLKLDANEPDPVTSQGYMHHARKSRVLDDLVPRIVAKVREHAGEPEGARIGLLVSGEYADDFDDESGYRYGAVHIEGHVNAAHLMNRHVPLGRWAIINAHAFDAVRPEFDPHTFLNGVPF